MNRICMRAAVLPLLCVLLACTAQGQDAPAAALPEGTRPFAEPITLRYGGFEHFTYTWRHDMSAAQTRAILEGWVMEGTMRPGAGTLHWSYRLSNIGRDGVPREAGRLEVATDAWGEVQQAQVVENRWSGTPGRPRAGADALFEAAALSFPLCCCPRAPVRMGDRIPLPPQGEVAPQTAPAGVQDTAEAVAAGVLDRDGRRFLVVRHTGRARSEEAGITIQARSSGHALIDVATCLPVSGTRVNSHEFTADGQTMRFDITRTDGTRH